MSCFKKLFKNYAKYKHWFYLAPALILLVFFNFYPLVKTIFISFDAEYNKFADVFSYHFNFKNYLSVFKDPDFGKAILNTFLLVFIAVPISILLSLFISVFLNNVYNYFLKKFLQTIFFLPYLTNTVIMGMVFAFLFYHNTYTLQNRPEGFFNNLLTILEKDSQNWTNIFASYFNKMFVLVFYVVWKSLPFQILIFSAGLQNISKDYYDAAKIDGASRNVIFRKITLPLLTPTIFYQLIIAMIQVFKEYESVVGIFGNNDSKINTIVGYTYKQLSNHAIDSYARGAVATIVLLFISIFFTIINFYFIEKKLSR